MSAAAGRLCAALLLPLALGAVRQEAAPRVRYRLEHEPAVRAADPRASRPACWTVEIEAGGLAPDKGPPTLAFGPWDDWIAVDSLWLEMLECVPPLAPGRAPGAPFVLAPGPDWDGALRCLYRIRLTDLGSGAQRARGLLPTLAPGADGREPYAFGYSWNTLLQVLQDGAPVRGRLTLELVAPEGMAIASGWGGLDHGRQEVALEPEMGNSPIAFGEPAAGGTSISCGGPMSASVEVWQYGAGRDVTSVVGNALAVLAPTMALDLGHPARDPLRAFVTDTAGGGMGSHYGLRIGFTAEEPEGSEHSVFFRSLIAHELFHDWLGTTLEVEGALVWFQEGFTEYLALWYAARTGLITRDEFAERLLEHEAIVRQRSALGSVAFADPEVAWRDGDGPNETLAYSGGALLALQIDVELRRAGKPGLPQLLRDLLAGRGRPSLEGLRAWLEANGLAALYERSIAGRELGGAAEALRSAGYERTELDEPLTYLGIQAADEDFPRVDGLDPEGPAARAGIRVGDRITGYFPVRGDGPGVRPDVVTPYRFGLTRFVPGHAGTYIGVRREDGEHQVFLEPELIPGGIREGLRAAGPALDPFFAFAPQP